MTERVPTSSHLAILACRFELRSPRTHDLYTESVVNIVSEDVICGSFVLGVVRSDLDDISRLGPRVRWPKEEATNNEWHLGTPHADGEAVHECVCFHSPCIDVDVQVGMSHCGTYRHDQTLTRRSQSSPIAKITLALRTNGRRRRVCGKTWE